MRIRVLILCAFLVTCTGRLYAQESKGVEYMEALMEEAMSSQRNRRATYEWIHCDVKKKITYQEWKTVKDRLKKRFFFGNTEFKEKEGAGLRSFEFIPYRDLPELVYTRWKPFDVPFSELKNKGKMRLYLGDDMTNEHLSLIMPTTLSDSKQLFYYLDVYWSGNIVKTDYFDYIDGDGVAFASYGKNNEYWICVQGTFKDGFPVNTHTNHIYSIESDDPTEWKVFKDITFTLSPFDENGYAVLTDAKGKDLAFVSKTGSGSLLPEDFDAYWEEYAIHFLKLFYHTNEDFKKMEYSKLVEMEDKYIMSQSYTNGALWYDHLPSKRYIGRDFPTVWSELLLEIYADKIKSGKSNLLSNAFSPYIFHTQDQAMNWRKEAQAMAKDGNSTASVLNLMMDVTDALHLTSKNNQDLYRSALYSRFRFLFIPSAYTILSRSDYWNVIEKGIDSAEKLKSQRPELKNELEADKKLLEDWLKQSRTILSAAIQWQREEDEREKQSLAAYRAEMCENCKIDGSKTTFPEGYVDKWEFLFMTMRPAQSEKDGRIVMANGEKINWRLVYYDENNPRIEADGDYIGTYDSVDEMMSNIVNKCKNNYCR